MKKRLLLGVLTACVILSSCKKKSKDEEEQPDPFKLEYSKLTTEEHKQDIEKAGIDFVAKLTDLPDQKFIPVLEYLTGLNPQVSESSLFERILTMGAESKDRDLKGLFNGIASTSSATSKLSDYYGIYTWNRSKQDWDESLSSNRVEIRFPSDETKLVNNAVLTLTYLPSKVKMDVDSGSKAELPAYINAVLKVDNVEELRLTSSYEYKENGIPTKIDQTVTLGVFSFKSISRNDGTAASQEWSFLKNSESLMSLKLGASGNTTLDTTVADADIVKNANASFQIMHISLLGEVDIKGYTEDSSTDGLADSVLNKKKAEKINKYARFVALNTKDNVIIAKAECLAVSEHGIYSIEPRLIFKDDSKMSLGAFFESGFQALIDDLDELADKF